jgi:hypothetical protein
MIASLAALEAADLEYGHARCGCLRAVVAATGHGCVLGGLPGVWAPDRPSGAWGPVPTPDGLDGGNSGSDTLRSA